MGNAPSVDVRRRPTHKLSKPRTGSHAPAGLLSPNPNPNNEPPNPRRRFSLSRTRSRLNSRPPPPPPSPVPPPTTPVSPTTTTTTTIDGTRHPDPLVEDPEAMVLALPQTEANGWNLFRSLPSQIASAKPRRRGNSVGPAPSASETPGRARSMTYDFTIGPHYEQQLEAGEWPYAPSRTSWNYNMSSYEAKRLLNVTEDAPFEHATSLSETRLSSFSEATWQSSNPDVAPFPPTPLGRTNSDLSMYTPVRRRSVVLTPGVATRTWDEPPLPPLPISMPIYHYGYTTSPSHSRQQSLESNQGGAASVCLEETNPEPVPRVATPCEDEYQSIGAFKLGSLRITNGSASPATPEIDRDHGGAEGRDGHGSQAAQQDYFTHLPAKQKHAPPQTSVEEVMPAAPDVKPATELLPPQQRSSEAGSRVSPPPLKTSSSGTGETSPQYLADMTQSPVSLANPRSRSPELQITSKHTAVEDKLFDDDGQPEYSAPETLDVRVDPSARFHPSQPTPTVDNSETSLKSVARTDSGFGSLDSPTTTDHSHKPLNKTDSGYGSSASIRSFGGSKHPLPDKDSTQSSDRKLSLGKPASASAPSEASESQLNSPVSSEPNTAAAATSSPLALPEQEDSPPPVPPKDFPPKKTLPKPDTTASRKASSSTNMKPRESRLYTRLSAPNISRRRSRHSPSPISSLRSVKSASMSPSPAPRTPGSIKSDVSSSTLSIGSGSHKLSRLQRFLGGTRLASNGPPTVHATHAIDESTIPSIPPDVQSRLRQHDGHLPIMPKRRTIQSQLSRDTLITEFSVCSLEQSLDAINSISSSPPLVTEGPPRDEAGEARRPGSRDLLSHIAQAGGKMMPRRQIPARLSSLKNKDGALGSSGLWPDPDEDAFVPRIDPTQRSMSMTGTGSGNAEMFSDYAVPSATHPEKDPPHRPRARRTRSLTSFIERNLDFRRIPHKVKSSTSMSNPPPDSLPSPLLPRTPSSPNRPIGTPPPTALRRPESLRFPQSLRDQSDDAAFGENILSPRTSRASIRSHLSSNPASSSLNASREDIHGYPSSYKYGPLPEGSKSPVSPSSAPYRTLRRSLSTIRPGHSHSVSQPIIPNWEVQTDHDISAQLTTSWLESQHAAGIRRTGTPPIAYNYRGRPSLPPLRHRSSYDVSSHGRGYPPSMSNGYTASPGRSFEPLMTNPQQGGPASSQLDQCGQLPYIPRGHYRNRSLGNVYTHPRAPPYRVLHSYNSPAYRNAPIWG